MVKPMIISKDWNPFPNDGSRYAFILLNTDGKCRCGLLGIKKTHYEYYDVATKWLQTIETALDSATDIPDDVVRAAKAILYDIYGNMTFDDEDCEEENDE